MLGMSHCATPSLSSLNRQLAKKGAPVTLRREDYGVNAVDATVLGIVRGAKPEELVGGLNQFEATVVVSPSGLAAAGWPLPVKAGDVVIHQGRTRTVVSATPIAIGDTVVRYDLKVSG